MYRLPHHDPALNTLVPIRYNTTDTILRAEVGQGVIVDRLNILRQTGGNPSSTQPAIH